jgi:uncharacterized membrane protein YkvA (DUF1232 family)
MYSSIKEMKMAEKKNSDIIVSQQGGVIRNTINQLKLILRLLGDRRVSVLAKLIPVGALAYLIMPADLLPGLVLPGIGALDDAALLWLGSYVFTELCPPEVVQEHMKALSGIKDENDPESNVVEGETTEVNDKSQQ